jgi:hypothetical protein
VRCRGIGYFQNLRNVLRIVLNFFWIFWGIFGDWGFFLGGFFGRNFFGGFFLELFFLEDFFGRIF